MMDWWLMTTYCSYAMLQMQHSVSIGHLPNYSSVIGNAENIWTDTGVTGP